MPSPRALGGLLAACLAATGLAGCGGDPSPSAWAASVCRALAPWRTEIASLTTRTQQQMTANTTPAQARENLVRLFDGAERASESARGEVAAAGVPDATNGEAVARGFVASLTAARDAYGRAADAIDALDTTRSEEFYDSVAEVLATLRVEYGRSALDTTRLDSPELKQAFEQVPECQ